MKKREMIAELESLRNEALDNEGSVYLGSYMSLDPCGRYHHILSPNGATSKCERYWELLEECADEIGAWIESGEGDPTDIYLCFPIATSENPNHE